MRAFSSTFALLFSTCALGAVLATAGCGSDPSGSSSGGSGGTTQTGTPGGPVDGAVDTHCTSATTVNPNACSGSGGTGGTGGAGGATGGAGGMPENDEYGATLFNAEGDDDECKYHLAWTSTDVFENTDVTFHVKLTAKADGKPVTGAAPDVEAFLNETHPAPNSDQKPTDKGGGEYDVGPVQFDKDGQWTVRFHLFEECADGETSPHGHVAFFLDVP